MFKIIVFVPLFLQLLVQSECLYAGESCFADDQGGTCISLMKCRPLLEEIKRAGNPMPLFMAKKLQILTCGFESRSPMVCCTLPSAVTQTPYPDHDDSLNSVTDNLEPFTRGVLLENKNGPATVESHPNIGLLPTSCGTIESDRIWGGNRTRLYEMPWMVLLSYDSGRGRKLSCGGTLINERYVLTAAHCVAFLGSHMKLKNVILGEYDVRQDPDCEMSDGKEYCAPGIMNMTIEEVIAHPGYTPQTLVDDIALIRLARPANLRLNSMKPICLPITNSLQKESLVGNSGVVAGWGVTEDGVQSPVLLSVDLPIITQQQCEDAYNGSPKVKETQLCAGGEKDKDSCGGDSGGPLMYPGQLGPLGTQYVQRGVVSYGSKRCGIGGVPGVYTNVAYYMNWILDNMHK